MLKHSIIVVGIAQSLFAAFVLGTRKKVTVSDWILIGLLLAITLRFLTRMMIGLYPEYLVTDLSVGIIPLSFGPFLYLYTKYLTRGDPPFNTRDLLHFVPFAIFLIVCMIFYQDQLSFNEVHFFSQNRFLWIRIIFGLIFFSSVLIYTIFIYILLSDYRRNILEDLNTLNTEKNLFWLNMVSLLFGALILSYIVIGGINALTFSQKIDLDLVSNLGLIVLVYAVSYFGLRQPSIFEFTYSKYPSLLNHKDSKVPVKSRTMHADYEKLADSLKQYMEADQPWLQSDLSLGDLASPLNISKSELTSVLNNHLGVNFFSYVNQYRLKSVIQKLEDPKYDHLTILSIAFDCGFNSKSTFNGLFKQHTGITPSEFRKRQALYGSDKKSNV